MGNTSQPAAKHLLTEKKENKLVTDAPSTGFLNLHIDSETQCTGLKVFILGSSRAAGVSNSKLFFVGSENSGVGTLCLQLQLTAARVIKVTIQLHLVQISQTNSWVSTLF